MRSITTKTLKYAVVTNGFGQSQQDIANAIKYLCDNMPSKYRPVMNHVARGIHELGCYCRSLNWAKILLRQELRIAYSYLTENETGNDDSGV